MFWALKTHRSCFGPFGLCNFWAQNNHSVLICIKLPMNLFFYMALAPYDFDAGQRHYLDHWKGWAMKVSTFLGPTLQMARVMSLPCIKIITARAK